MSAFESSHTVHADGIYAHGGIVDLGLLVQERMVHGMHLDACPKT